MDRSHGDWISMVMVMLLPSLFNQMTFAYDLSYSDVLPRSMSTGSYTYIFFSYIFYGPTQSNDEKKLRNRQLIHSRYF